MWPLKKSREPEAPQGRTPELIGPWRLVPDQRDSNPYGDHAMEFTPFGDLIYTTLAEGQCQGRMLLTYHVDGSVLVTDQPSSPREERTPFEIDGDFLRIGCPGEQTVLERQAGSQRTDPFAPLFGIGSAAVAHGLDSAHPDDAFIPFLFIDDRQNRKLIRIIHSTPEEARDAAVKQFLQLAAQAVAVAWAYDGRITLGNEKTDCVLVEVSYRGCPDALLFAQPYTFDGNTAVRAGGLLTQMSATWF